MPVLMHGAGYSISVPDVRVVEFVCGMIGAKAYQINKSGGPAPIWAWVTLLGWTEWLYPRPRHRTHFGTTTFGEHHAKFHFRAGDNFPDAVLLPIRNRAKSDFLSRP